MIHDDMELIEYLRYLGSKYPDKKWILRESELGRGFRLHQTTREGAVGDVGQAIMDFRRRITSKTIKDQIGSAIKQMSKDAKQEDH